MNAREEVVAILAGRLTTTTTDALAAVDAVMYRPSLLRRLLIEAYDAEIARTASAMRRRAVNLAEHTDRERDTRLRLVKGGGR